MDNTILVDSGNFAFGDVRKGEKLGGFERKKLSDISNLQERPKPTNLDPTRKSTATITSKEYVDKLQKENAELMKLLADRNKLIELSVVELRKLRINLQKVQLQNSQLAQANSQMLAELNSGKDRLKVLQHDLACKNGLLKARKLEAGERRKRVAACEKANYELGSSHGDELGKSSQEDKENEPNGNQRKQSRKQTLGYPPVKPVNDDEANKKRRCSRRQSARLKSKESEATEDSFEVDDTGFLDSSLHDDPVGTSCQTLVESSAKNDNEGNAVCENINLPGVNAVHATKESDKRRRSRRQSARFIKSEATQDSIETEGSKLDVSSQHDDVINASGQTIQGLIVNEEDESNGSSGIKTEESRRSSVGRPLRRAAEKVQSYKEIPLNLKMRRTQ